MIGRLGIGILGISQISHKFSIVSHARKARSAFRAWIEMKDFRREILDQAKLERSSDLASGQDDESPTPGFPVGDYRAESIPFDPQRTGMMITATEPTEGFRQQLSEDDLDPLPKEFRMFCQASGVKDALATGPLYNRMVWQVASLSPVPYMLNGVESDGDESMTSIIKTLQKFNFAVIVDGVKLFKPVLLDVPASVVPYDTVGYGEGPFHFPLELDEVVWGSKLSVRGYLYSSAGTALHPDDIRGMLIRLKHVGIGEYDKSFLDYRYAEGPRFAWLTGEIFIEHGLDDALTVGRDGFDAGHPHYVALRTWLHTQLRSRVFPTLYRSIESRRLKREAIRQETRTNAFLNSISGFAEVPIEIRETADRGEPPVRIDLKQGSVVLNTAATWPRGRRQREMAQRLSIIFELVRLVDSDKEAIHDFVRLTRELLLHR